ncbi:hypothetical protein CA85_51280 [Allorhodopirellula solitaria]|uniref:DUF1819 domain-containing protein n=2 Tax=Allorhodopirellula solitaria TaxID=2527987 RepID=A0A5C5WN10_9BACT|nr:hypothetical protein CA85_51280 [Allorhodopirellula solitaria]
MQYKEETQPHTRMMKCTLEIEPSRSYWHLCESTGGSVSKEKAFEESVFGSKTFLRVERLIADMRHRYDAYPFALEVLGKWRPMELSDRALICHWHTQLADPIYRKFTGDYLVERYYGPAGNVDNDMTSRWIELTVPDRWQIPTRNKIASKMLTSALSAGIIASNRNPRPILFPRVSDLALCYLMYLLREIQYEGSAISNPYLTSVGLDQDEAVRRIRGIRELGFSKQGDLLQFDWQHDSMMAWACSAGILAEVDNETNNMQRAAT